MSLTPTWRIQPAAKGATLIVGGFTYHPGDDPVRRGRMDAMEVAVVAERHRAKKALLVGFGLGYMAAPLSTLVDIPLGIWDSLPVAQSQRRERMLLTARRAKVFLSEEEVQGFLDPDTVVMVHETASDLHYWDVQFCEATFARMNKHQIKGISQRSIDFLQRLPRLGLAQEHYGRAKGGACVICSPGPSLDLERVKKMSLLGYTVICAAQCLGALNKAGIVPDITVCLDPQPVIYDRLCEGEWPGWVYADAMVDPRIWDRHPDRCFAFSVPTAHCHAMVWREMGYDWLEGPAITVSECMLQIASKLGFGSVFTSGVDYWAPERTPLLRMECEGGRWSWSHYYAGSRAWAYLERTLHMQTFPLGDQVMEQAPATPPVELPPPSSQVPEATVTASLRSLLHVQSPEAQTEIMSKLAPSIREAFAPLAGTAPVVVCS